MSRFLVGITGASGSIYGTRLLHHLKNLNHQVSLVVTKTGKQVVTFEHQKMLYSMCDEVLDIEDFFAYAASGSGDFQGMTIAPCSMGTLGKIASGITDNLLVRAADVCLKEGKPLVLVPREMPLHEIHLENMLKLSKLGTKIIPAMPHFYTNPQTIEALVDTVVAKVLTHLGIKNNIVPFWGNPKC